jgi:acetyl esterase
LPPTLVLLGVHALLALAASSSLAAQRATADDAAPAPVRHVYHVADGQPLAAHVFRSAGARGGEAPGVVLMVHGGGWTGGRPESTFAAARHFADLGHVAVAIEYRLSRIGGATPVDALSDVCAAMGWVRREAQFLGLASARVAAYGVSAGGHLVAAAATAGCADRTAPPDALLLLTPVLDVAEHEDFAELLPPGARPLDLSPIEHLSPAVPPVHIVQGAEDTVAPTKVAERFCERLTLAGGRCVLDLHAGLGHVLTRRLDDQESGFDPDPLARVHALEQHASFLRRLWKPEPQLP